MRVYSLVENLVELQLEHGRTPTTLFVDPNVLKQLTNEMGQWHLPPPLRDSNIVVTKLNFSACSVDVISTDELPKGCLYLE